MRNDAVIPPWCCGRLAAITSLSGCSWARPWNSVVWRQGLGCHWRVEIDGLNHRLQNGIKPFALYHCKESGIGSLPESVGGLCRQTSSTFDFSAEHIAGTRRNKCRALRLLYEFGVFRSRAQEEAELLAKRASEDPLWAGRQVLANACLNYATGCALAQGSSTKTLFLGRATRSTKTQHKLAFNNCIGPLGFIYTCSSVEICL